MLHFLCCFDIFGFVCSSLKLFNVDWNIVFKTVSKVFVSGRDRISSFDFICFAKYLCIFLVDFRFDFVEIYLSSPPPILLFLSSYYTKKLACNLISTTRSLCSLPIIVNH
jgi:hypothetical protein